MADLRSCILRDHGRRLEHACRIILLLLSDPFFSLFNSLLSFLCFSSAKKFSQYFPARIHVKQE